MEFLYAQEEWNGRNVLQFLEESEAEGHRMVMLLRMDNVGEKIPHKINLKKLLIQYKSQVYNPKHARAKWSGWT